MSYTDKKITQEEINAHHVQGATDYLIGNAQQNKAVFDNLPEFIAGKHNELIDELNSQHGEEIQAAVNEWLAEHPEATTTVQDNSLTTAKYVDGSVTGPKIANGSVTPLKLDRAYTTPSDLTEVNNALTNEINVLDARMDEFASLPDGSTAGNAELLDIRVGTDGTSYPSAGAAVRGQFNILNSDLKNQLGLILNINPSWETGFWAATPSTTRQDYVRTKTGIAMTNGDVLYLNLSNTGWERIQFNYYDENDVYLSRTELRKATINSDIVYWTFSNSDATTVKLNVWSGSVSVHLDPSLFGAVFMAINITDFTINKIEKVTNTIPIYFEYGNISILADSWSYPATPSRTRIRNPINTTIHAQVGDILHCKDYTNAKYFIGGKNVDGTSLQRGWLTSDYTFEKECEFVILATHRYEETEIVSLDEFAALFWIIRNNGNSDIIAELTNSTTIAEREFYRNPNIKGNNHRGWLEAPENTLLAFKMSRAHGFKYVETDVRTTKDGHLVCLHDPTVDRTSNGTGEISQLTLAEVRELDFGSYKSPIYAGEKIPTIEEFLLLCKRIGLHPYFDTKVSDTASIQNLLNLVKETGMKNRVSYTGGADVLARIKELNDSARLGLVTTNISATEIDAILPLKTATNEIFIDAQIDAITDAGIQLAIDADIPVELWNVLHVSQLANINSYVTGLMAENFVPDIEMTKLYLGAIEM